MQKLCFNMGIRLLFRFYRLFLSLALLQVYQYAIHLALGESKPYKTRFRQNDCLKVSLSVHAYLGIRILLL